MIRAEQNLSSRKGKDKMFQINSNQFITNGICKYEDEYGNTAFFRRDNEKEFTARLRFHNKNVQASSLHITLPIPENDKNGGIYMKLDYLDGIPHEDEDITEGISEFTALVQKWISMLMDIQYMECNNGFLMKANEGVSIEDIYFHKLNLLSQYEELKPVLSAIFY